MRSLQIATIVSLSVAMLLPAAALANNDGPYYTTSDPDADPNANGLSLETARGVGDDPDDDTVFQEACKYFRNGHGGTAGAYVYWHNVAEKQWYRFVLQSDGSCVSDIIGPTSQPPEDGVLVAPPLIVGSLIAVGSVLLLTAWILSRRLQTESRPT